ncbi:MAG: hypothetical protein EAZ78_13915 [Oscillatoriales cyanobacterium]|uniref:hypothetical protein n=1 Tax=Microcoleus anatoxicus TaxID=2705319 RepID=UPI002976E0F8|nr:MAG: hypothetical protein EA000_01665 [Oscillatoriales cyanobacterium]TAF03005.1 MAG: hypothetical protein EAZ78_13915 [Oscillatoriales cyanobacterium]TAF71300.1 MAG: hypothetical protein EAZ59_01350 [Oscillatoriales cyanobacterium]
MQSSFVNSVLDARDVKNPWWLSPASADRVAEVSKPGVNIYRKNYEFWKKKQLRYTQDIMRVL